MVNLAKANLWGCSFYLHPSRSNLKLLEIRLTWVGVRELFLFTGLVTLRHLLSFPAYQALDLVNEGGNVGLILFHWLVVSFNVTLQVTCLAERLAHIYLIR